jgi:hypothetical protein
MAITTKNRKQLKAYFVKNAIPTEGNFSDLVDAQLNQAEDGVFKLPGEPLSVVAAPGDQRRVLRFYSTYPAANPDWQISLAPAQDPGDPASARPGFGVSDGAGRARLYIDPSTGNLGVGTNAPSDRLTVSGGDLRIEGDGYHRLKVLAVNAGVELVARNPGGTPHIDFTQGQLDSLDYGLRLIATDNNTLHLQGGLGPPTLRVQGDLVVDGAQNKLDTREQGAAVVRAHDLLFGHSGRRGAPGRALVDSSDTLVFNWGADWKSAAIHSPLTVHGALTVEGAVHAKGAVNAPAGLNFQGNVAHIDADGALYRHTDGQVYLTVDDILYIRDLGAKDVAAAFNTDQGNLHLKNRISARALGIGLGDADPAGPLEVRVAGSGGGWDRLVVTANAAWGNGNQHVTIGAGGGAGIMIHNPHIPWFAEEKRATIRYGMSLPNKIWWDVGLREDDSFQFATSAGGTPLALRRGGIAVGGDLTVSGGVTTNSLQVNSGLQVNGALTVHGALNKLDVSEQGVATIRAHDLNFGHSGRRGAPGRALVDNKDALILNYGDWPRAEILSPLTVHGDATITGHLRVGAWSLEATATALLIKCGPQVVARFATEHDRFQVYRHLNGQGPYFWYNSNGNFGA